jgi:hypothetical protein
VDLSETRSGRTLQNGCECGMQRRGPVSHKSEFYAEWETCGRGRPRDSRSGDRRSTKLSAPASAPTASPASCRSR